MAISLLQINADDFVTHDYLPIQLEAAIGHLWYCDVDSRTGVDESVCSTGCTRAGIYLMGLATIVCEQAKSGAGQGGTRQIIEQQLCKTRFHGAGW